MSAPQRGVLAKTLCIFHVQAPAVAHGNRAFDHHHGVWVHPHHQVNHLLHVARVEIVANWVIVRRGGNHHEVGIPVGILAVERGPQPKVLLRQIPLNILVLNRRKPLIDQFHFLRNHIHCRHIVLLCQQSRYRQAHIACPCHCYLHRR